MLLCASNAEGTAFECLDPPADAPVGERVMVSPSKVHLSSLLLSSPLLSSLSFSPLLCLDLIRSIYAHVFAKRAVPDDVIRLLDMKEHPTKTSSLALQRRG